MTRSWQRILAGLAAGCVALLLAGCEIRGTVEVRSETEVVANLVITEAEADCLGLTRFAGLVVKGTPDPDGDQLCRAQGTVDLAELRNYGVSVSQLGEYLLVDVALPRRLRDMPIDIDITFPGPVLDAGATTATGNQVRLREGVGVANFTRTRVIARSHSGPQWWVIGLAAGFTVGVGLTLAFLLVMRRRRLPAQVADSAAPDHEPESPPTGSTAAPAPGVTAVPTAPSGPAPAQPAPAVRDLDYEAWFAPPSTGREPPAAAGPAAPAGAPEPEPATDHRIWAPPADQGDR